MLPDSVRTHLLSAASLSYAGEVVDQLAHSLQCASLAVAADADPELVAAALLHDIGRVPALADLLSGAPHERVGAAYVGALFGRRAGWLVGAHVVAKRVLVSLDQAYADWLSPASVASLGVQGGVLPPDRIERFLALPYAQDALSLRRWDDAAKIEGAETMPLDDLLATLRPL